MSEFRRDLSAPTNALYLKFGTHDFRTQHEKDWHVEALWKARITLRELREERARKVGVYTSQIPAHLQADPQANPFPHITSWPEWLAAVAAMNDKGVK